MTYVSRDSLHRLLPLGQWLRATTIVDWDDIDEAR